MIISYKFRAGGRSMLHYTAKLGVANDKPYGSNADHRLYPLSNLPLAVTNLTIKTTGRAFAEELTMKRPDDLKNIQRVPSANGRRIEAHELVAF